VRKKSRLYKKLYILSASIGIVILGLLIGMQFLKMVEEEFEPNFFKVQIKASENEEDYLKESKLSLIMVGDSLIHSAVYADAKNEAGYDFRPMLENLKPYIQEYDLAFYNQESILGGTELGLSTYPRFNSPYEVGDAFRDCGFNLVSLANNHTLDRGEAAILNSKNYWNQYKDILTAGSYQSLEEKNTMKIKEKNGITYTLLSYTDTTNGLSTPPNKEYLINRYDEEKVKTDIENVRDKVDLLLVSIHFGTEYTHTPTERQRQIAENLANLGVDIVIGHHPHVVQPVEFIGNTMVIYSLGNFISAQRGVEKLTGLMTSIVVKKTTIGEISKITLEQPKVELVYTASEEENGYRKNFKLYRYQDLTDEILPGYESYQQKFLKLVTKENSRIETR